MILLRVSAIFHVLQLPDFAGTNMLLMLETLTCLKLASTRAKEKKNSVTISTWLGSGSWCLPAFKCKDTFHLWSMHKCTPYLLSCSLSCRMVILLTNVMVDRPEEWTFRGDRKKETVENRDRDLDRRCWTRWSANRSIYPLSDHQASSDYCGRFSLILVNCYHTEAHRHCDHSHG